MRVFVTGAGGFIGRRLVSRLAEQGATVSAMASLRGGLGDVPSLPGVQWIRGDALDFEMMAANLQGHDAVIHLAGRYPLFGEEPAPLTYVQANAMTAAVTLEASRQSGVRRFVLASSAQVYGRPARTPIAESGPLDGSTPYAASKIGAEALVRSYASSYGFGALSLRLFNVYGPGQNSSNVAATVAVQALRPGPVTIYSAAPERDFVYVDDAARALLAAAGCDEGRGQAINIGSGEGIQIGDLARRIMRAAGRDDDVVSRLTLGAGARDSYSVVADIRLAESLLGWRPSVALDDGLALTVDWTRHLL